MANAGLIDEPEGFSEYLSDDIKIAIIIEEENFKALRADHKKEFDKMISDAGGFDNYIKFLNNQVVKGG